MIPESAMPYVLNPHYEELQDAVGNVIGELWPIYAMLD